MMAKAEAVKVLDPQRCGISRDNTGKVSKRELFI